MLDCQITIAPTLVGVGPTVAMVQRWARDCGLPCRRAAALALATDELLTDVAKFAFPQPIGNETITICLERTPHALEVRVEELGEPFDPDMHQWQPQQAADNDTFEGAGLALIEGLVDRFIFLNRGAGGKEFRMFINLPEDARIAPATITAEPEETGNYQLAAATPKDAEDISRLIHRTYGYSYRREEAYFPARVALALERQEKFGVIVRTPKGAPVGWFAVVQGTDSNVGEVAEAVVSPDHRHRGIMTMMMDALIAEARQRQLLGLYGQAVTAHQFSQRVNARCGFHSTALLLADYPAMHFRDLVDNYPQDVSVVVDYRPLADATTHIMFLPTDYATILQDVATGLGWTLETADDDTALLVGKSELDVKLDRHDYKATIIARRLGADLPAVVPDLLTDLANNEIRTIYFDAPLDVPEVRAAISPLRACGFIFAGLMPRFHRQRNYFRLQNIAAKLDFRLIAVYSDVAKALKHRVSSEYAQ